MDMSNTESSKFTVGQRFALVVGQPVVANGYPGSVTKVTDFGMVEVRLARGGVCVSPTFPNCYPAAQ